MKIMLIGGGSGGHITPLRAVAHEIKQLHPDAQLLAVCETGNKFIDIYKKSDDIDKLYQIRAGKYRRYSGQTRLQRLLDFETNLLNIRDMFRTVRGYIQAKRLLKRERPDVLLIKGGFVAVPVGLAAARLRIPYITHDSDSTPGLANRIIGRWARTHATGMPAELYNYPKSSTVYTGIPVSSDFSVVDTKSQAKFRSKLGLKTTGITVAVIGGSQGGQQLNHDVLSVATELMGEMDDLNIVHIAGAAHTVAVKSAYKRRLTRRQFERVIVKGFVDDLSTYTGAADIVVTRASATAIAELSLQSKALIVVPGQLADGHQHKNADFLVAHNAALQVEGGNQDSLKTALVSLLTDARARKRLATHLRVLAKPQAALELAVLTIGIAQYGENNEAK